MTVAYTSVSYFVAPVTADPGYSPFEKKEGCIPDGDVQPGRPGTITLSQDGSITAFVEYSSTRCEERIVVLRPGGRSSFTSPATRFRKSDSEVYFTSELKVSDGGVLFATVVDRFSGAYIGERKSTYEFVGRRWKAVGVPGTATGCSNVTVGAVEDDAHFALNVDCEDQFLPSLDEVRDPRYGPHAVIVNTGRTADLGQGTILSLTPAGAAGYEDALHHGTSPQATSWIRDRSFSHGDGVAFAINNLDATTVGDNRKDFDQPGQPFLWRGSQSVTLSEQAGSCLAISENTAVGFVLNQAFVVKTSEAPRTLRILTDRSRLYVIRVAFAIGTNGRILALGEDRNKREALLTVDSARRVAGDATKTWHAMKAANGFVSHVHVRTDDGIKGNAKQTTPVNGSLGSSNVAPLALLLKL